MKKTDATPLQLKATTIRTLQRQLTADALRAVAGGVIYQTKIIVTSKPPIVDDPFVTTCGKL